MSAMKLIKNVKNRMSGKRLPKEAIPYLLKAVESADQLSRNDIENQLVKIGENSAHLLVKELSNCSGKTRGLIAMALVRIGYSAIPHLEAAINESSEWAINYIINEIKGSRISLTQKDNISNVLVG
ncbi:MAG: hypothetical protein WCK67_01730 [bacterium]